MASYGSIAVIAVAAAALSSSCAVVNPEQEQEVVLIAADLEISGDYSELGQVYRDALELRVEQVNQEGLLRGNRRLELEVHDNRSDSDAASRNLASLAADPSVTAVITGSCDVCVVTAAETINSAGVPTISLAAADAVASPVEERRSIFKLGPNAGDVASLMAAELIRSNAREIAVVSTDDAYGMDGMREVTSAAERAEIEVVIAAEIGSTEDTLRVASEIATYSSTVDPLFGVEHSEPTGPDAVVLWGLQPFPGEVAMSLQEAGYGGPLYLDPSAAGALFLAGDTRSAFANATMISTETLVIDEVVATSPAKTARKTWFRTYTARYGTYHAMSSYAADAVELIVHAVNRVDSKEREAVRGAIEGLQIDGLSGPIRMTPTQHSGIRPQALTLLIVQGDRWRMAG